MEKSQFINGLFVYKPSERAPEFIKANLSLNKKSFIEWLNTQPEDWLKIDILESKDKTKWYASLNTYKKPETVANQTPIPPYKEERLENSFGEIPF